MLELAPDAEHLLTDDIIAKCLDFPAAQIKHINLLHHMAFANGSLAVRAVLRRAGIGSGEKAICHIEIADRVIRGLDLSSRATSREKEAYAENDWASIPLGNDILYLQGTSQAFLVARDGDPRISHVQIEGGLGYVEINAEVSARLRPSRYAHPVSDGNAAAIPLSDGSRSSYLAVLTIEPDRLRARWSRFAPQDEGSQTDRSLLSRLFSKPAMPALPEADGPIRLCAEDFPHVLPGSDQVPLIDEALLRNEPLRVCRRLFRLSHAAMAGSSSMA